jgi:hypothetical protein
MSAHPDKFDVSETDIADLKGSESFDGDVQMGGFAVR